jgi:glycosyltransferase involved in cell wall biosynthesis
MRPKRVMHLLWTFQLAGAEKIAHTLLDQCRTRGWEPFVCALSPQRPEQAAHWSGIQTHVVPKRSGLDPLLPFRLAALFRREAIDILHTHNATCGLYGALACKLARIAHVHTEHSNLPSGRRALRTFAKWSLRTAAVVADSKKVAAILVRRDHFPEDRVRLIYNGIHLNGHSPMPDRLRMELGIPENAFVIGTIGNLRPVKNHRVLIDAFAKAIVRFPNLMLVILGEGDERQALQKLAEEKGVSERVRLPGFRENASADLGAIDLFVLPSQSEGLPLSLLEAMSAGKPCIASAVGGIPEIISDGLDGLLIPANSAKALERALEKCLQEPEGMKEFGTAARRRAAFFDEKTMTHQYFDLYQEVL